MSSVPADLPSIGRSAGIARRARSPSRYALVALLAAFYVASSTVLRLALAAKAIAAGQIGWSDVPAAAAIGAGYDAVTAASLCTPFAVYLLAVPARVYRSRWHRGALRIALALAAFGIAYLGVVEYFFFDEFNARFNFIAVEYLIYPHEVFVNIWESYPVGRALAASAAVAVVYAVLTRGVTGRALEADARLRRRLAPALVLLAAAAAAQAALNLDSGRRHRNRVADEIAANGVYSFFAAAMSNALDYPQYYVTLDTAEAAARVRRLVGQANATFDAHARNPLARRILYAAPANPLHVIVVLEESLGAEFVGAYGDGRGLTPNIDRLAERALVFRNVYATGTRTVRGMEAVTASFPPVPAESIVKRRHNERMFNWSTVMAQNGYTPTFIYGGYGTFDNMNHFFANNGYRVVDRTDMDEPAFANIWGVSDEDLFRNALRVFDAQVARGERVFSVVMTTSNHKPFTFPEGIPGVQARGGGREAGVRYADHALGRFIAKLEERPWFRDAMVVVVADHGARVYGREDIPLPTYRIPFLVYSPAHVPSGTVDTLVSQLDVAPTVLGLLRISYDSVFFGRDALADGVARLAVLNHNRDIALYRDGVVSELGFRKLSATFAYDAGSHRQRRVGDDHDGVHDAAALFQLAYQLYASRGYRLE